MTDCNPPPPRYRLPGNLTPARLRLGKMVACLVLAGLVVAGGMAFPTARQDAEAYSNRAGYSYTQRFCQEWGRQPRYYYVRDEVEGSDWRTSGGWAIILEGSGAAQSVGEWVQDNDIVSPSIRDGNSVQLYLGTSALWPAYRYTSTNQPALFIDGALTQPKLVVDNSRGPFHGRQGLIQTGGGGTHYSNIAWIDQNGDGNVDAADKTAGPGNNQYERLLYRARTVTYGGTYIRWASMAWCR